MVKDPAKLYELFDLKKDPYESTNLATSRPERLRVLVKLMKSSLETHGAQPPQLNGKALLPQ